MVSHSLCRWVLRQLLFLGWTLCLNSWLPSIFVFILTYMHTLDLSILVKKFLPFDVHAAKAAL
jgi:hypothetical protein